ncbi:MAG TPA: glycosyltransferase family 9 protein [Pirellulales bacterium]|nr:glycosyltransferase family 9 protein [Pirellulales bacterium]
MDSSIFMDESLKLRQPLGDPPPAKIAVFRALQLGDLLCATPAMRALRRALPFAEIVLIGLPWSREFVKRFDHYVDSFLEFPGFPGLPERSYEARAVRQFLAKAQRAKFDLAIQLHGSGAIVNPMLALLGARLTAGFYVPGEWLPDAKRFMPYPDGEHEVHRHLRLMEFLDVPSAGDELEFPLHSRDYEEFADLASTYGIRSGEYVCIHPGARFPSRRWPLDRFARTADGLARLGFQIVITGSGEEKELADALSDAIDSPHLNLAGKTSLGALGVLLEGARLLVSNDTGVSHIASALRTPSILIVTGSDAKRWAPLDGSRHRVVRHRVACQPCEHVVCPIDHPCGTGVEVSNVLEIASELLETFGRQTNSCRLAQRNSGAQIALPSG